MLRGIKKKKKKNGKTSIVYVIDCNHSLTRPVWIILFGVDEETRLPYVNQQTHNHKESNTSGPFYALPQHRGVWADFLNIWREPTIETDQERQTLGEIKKTGCWLPKTCSYLPKLSCFLSGDGMLDHTKLAFPISTVYTKLFFTLLSVLPHNFALCWEAMNVQVAAFTELQFL